MSMLPMVSMLPSEARFARAIDAVRARIFSSEPWSLRPRVDDATVRALHALETRWSVAPFEERAALAGEAEALAASLEPRRMVTRRRDAEPAVSAERRLGTALGALEALLQKTDRALSGPFDMWGRSDQTDPYRNSARQLLERWKKSTTAEERERIARDAEALLKNATEVLRAGKGATTFGEELSSQIKATLDGAGADWKKWALLGGGMLGGVVLLRALLR